MLLQSKPHHDGAILEKAEQRILRLREPGEQKERLCQHRLADQKGCVEFLDTRGHPTVISFRSIEEGDQRPRINDRLRRARNL